MKIKTVVHDTPEKFDEQVNKALEQGFNLIETGPRQVGPDCWKLYALLKKYESPDDVEDW